MERQRRETQKAIQDAGLTALARELGVSFPTLNSWILGKSQPRPKAKKRIDTWYLRITGKNVVQPQAVELKKNRIMQLRYRHAGVIRQLTERPDLYDQFLLSLTYNTNRIEGSTLTEPETAAILMNGIRDDAGRYRNHAVRIAGSYVPTANYLKVPDLMKELVSTIEKNGSTDTIGFSAQTHSRFEQIHPFSDGNGRVGRLLLWAILMAHDIAPAVISQEYRRYYIMYLNQSQLNGDYSKLEDFLCDAIITGYGIINHE